MFFKIETGKKYWLQDLKVGNQDFKGKSLANIDATSSTIVEVRNLYYCQLNK